MAASRAFITGIGGTALRAEERGFLREAAPWGLILFKRNIADPAQVAALVAECRDVLGWSAPVLIDQEGGRVQRLSAPCWPEYPPGSAYGRLYAAKVRGGLRAAWLGARLIAADLAALGIDVDCAPLADLPVAGADAIIGDRAYGTTVDQVVALAGAFAEGLLAGGVLPVLKHLPGHGRAPVDSHLRLPVVDAPEDVLDASDFAAFRPLAGVPLGMTAHVVYSALDPATPATLSRRIVQHVIRDSIGFQGLLMSDDISMGALSGTLADRSRGALAAGCDLVLHCNGVLAEMEAVAAEAPLLAGEAAARAARALAARRPAEPLAQDEARAEFAALMAAQPDTAGNA